MSKQKAAFYWCASCGGCDEAVIDLAENLIPVAESFEIVFWPFAMDFKLSDLKELENGSIAVSFINGSIRTEEHEVMVKLLREKSQLLVALGSCACLGGVPALSNLTSRRAHYQCSYHALPSVDNQDGAEPKTKTIVEGNELSLPHFYETVYKLDDIVGVDYYLPGCAPAPDLIADTLRAICESKLPAKGTILSPDRSLCSSCKLNETKPEDIAIKEVKRIIDVILDAETCFLNQQVVCMGPATRDGCGAACIEGNMPCTGCFGPTDSCKDQGGKMISMLGTIVEGNDERSVAGAFQEIVDPAGTFYRYSLSGSLLGRAGKEDE